MNELILDIGYCLYDSGKKSRVLSQIDFLHEKYMSCESPEKPSLDSATGRSLHILKQFGTLFCHVSV